MVLCTLKKHVLQKMRQTIDFSLFIIGAGTHQNEHCHGLSAVHLRDYHAQAICKRPFDEFHTIYYSNKNPKIKGFLYQNLALGGRKNNERGKAKNHAYGCASLFQFSLNKHL